mmetsp:Transcript_60000/g.176061  ORF Transcript_60000/g.176061 Transcript_60000/m.176061 type:complete len:267 (-) Transcript_60000:2117-2917(-)
MNSRSSARRLARPFASSQSPPLPWCSRYRPRPRRRSPARPQSPARRRIPAACAPPAPSPPAPRTRPRRARSSPQTPAPGCTSQHPGRSTTPAPACRVSRRSRSRSGRPTPSGPCTRRGPFPAAASRAGAAPRCRTSLRGGRRSLMGTRSTGCCPPLGYRCQAHMAHSWCAQSRVGTCLADRGSTQRRPRRPQIGHGGTRSTRWSPPEGRTGPGDNCNTRRRQSPAGTDLRRMDGRSPRRWRSLLGTGCPGSLESCTKNRLHMPHQR